MSAQSSQWWADVRWQDAVSPGKNGGGDGQVITQSEKKNLFKNLMTRKSTKESGNIKLCGNENRNYLRQKIIRKSGGNLGIKGLVWNDWTV